MLWLYYTLGALGGLILSLAVYLKLTDQTFLQLLPGWFHVLLSGLLFKQVHTISADDVEGLPCSKLQPITALHSEPFFEDKPSAEHNCIAKYGAQVQLNLTGWMAAVDFEAKDVEDRPVVLRDLLLTKPVILITGGKTCPVWNTRIDDQEALAPLYGDQFHLLFLVSAEAHPKGEDSWGTGALDIFGYSSIGDPKSYAERKAGRQ
jgi:hypothetical protein